MRRFSPRALLATAAFAALVTPAHAQADAWGGEIAVMDEAEMDNLRGGFKVNGVEIQFGVLMTTILNGRTVLQTRFTIDDAGALTEQTSPDFGGDLGTLTPEQRAVFGAAGLEGANGVVLEGETGLTAVVHNLSNRALQNIVLNTASGQDIEQHFSVMLTLPGFEAIQADYETARLGFSIADDMSGVRFGN